MTKFKFRIFTPKKCFLGCSALFSSFFRHNNGSSRLSRKTRRRYSAFRSRTLKQRIDEKTLKRAVMIGAALFCLYFTFIGFVSFVAISNHRVRSIHFRLNGSLDTVYGDVVLGNGSLEDGTGLITIERVEGSQYNLYSSKDDFLADVLRSQTLFKCVPISFRKNLKSTSIALVSFPGSGNTWLRYLLQLATGGFVVICTGVFTGSIYKDYALLRNGFPGEGISDGRVLVSKTHEIGLIAREQFQKAILLVRKPSEAILAEFNRRMAGHIGQAGRDKYTRNDGHYWSQFVAQKAKLWTETNLDWIEHFNGPLLISMYTHLVHNTSEELLSILNFLQEATTDKVMLCVLENKEGIYRRRKKYTEFNPFSLRMKKFLAVQERIVVKAIEKRMSTRNIQRLNQIGRLKLESGLAKS